ncbi:MAG: glycosyltransferase, partial [Alphaproteobacteria bacterium]
MKILVIQETDWIKRGPHTQHHLMDRMALRGHKIRVIDYDYLWKEDHERKIFSHRRVFENAYKTLENSNITLIRPGMIKISGLDMASILYFHTIEIKRQIEEFKPDVIIAFGILNAYIGLNYANKNNIPFVYYLLDHLHCLLPTKLTQIIAKQFEKSNIRRADQIFVLNQGLKDYVGEMGGNLSKVYILPSGVDLDKFNLQIDGSIIRKKYGIKKNEILLFFMGWIYEFSGMKEVAESLANFESDSIKLMVVGDGDLYNTLYKMSSEENLKNKLILTGKVPFEQIPSYIAAADICLLPAYKNEIMMNIVPIKLYEYMAMGKPVIATNLPGIKKEFGNSSGIVYVDDPKETLNRAIELIDTNLMWEYSEKSLKYTQNYGWDSQVLKFEK